MTEAPLARSRALWNRSEGDLESDEVLAQILDRGEIDVWREVYCRAKTDARLRQCIARIVLTVPTPAAVLACGAGRSGRVRGFRRPRTRLHDARDLRLGAAASAPSCHLRDDGRARPVARRRSPRRRSLYCPCVRSLSDASAHGSSISSKMASIGTPSARPSRRASRTVGRVRRFFSRFTCSRDSPLRAASSASDHPRRPIRRGS
jgi:hypothetical protein